MKSFFDQLGKIGEILAPIPGSPSPFFYAIQHHNNAEVQSTLLNCGDVDVTRMTENGYFPIHCACQFNNLFAVDLMMGRGVHVDFPDLLGNTPLHYAAKYGHPDLCKVLIDRGSFAGVKNNQGQTAYDVCSGPSVGQYLQPQHFASNMQNMGGNTTGDIYCQTQGHVMGNSNYSMTMQPAQYSAEQPVAYIKPAEYPPSFSQEQQQTYPTPVQISQQAPMVQGLVINQSNSISTPASPLISGNNQMKNVHANMFGRNDVPLQKTVVNTQDHTSGQSSNIGPPSFNTPPVRPLSAGNSNYLASISPHLPSPMKAPQATPQQLLPQAPQQQQLQQQQLPIPQITHPSPHKQIQIIPPPQQIHQVPPQQIHQVPPQQIHQVPPQQIHQVPPQQIHQVPPQQIHQVPQQQIHQVPPQQIHQVPTQQIHNQLPNNFNSGYYPGSSPPVSQILPPPIIPQNPSYKPVAVNGSLSRIIQPDGFHTSASDPELQKKYGHTRNVIDIAPPPIFNAAVGMNAPPTYGSYNTQPPIGNYQDNQNNQNNHNFMPPQAYGSHIGNGPKH